MIALLPLLIATKVADLISFDTVRARTVDPTIEVLPVTDAAVRRSAKATLARALAKYPAQPLLRQLRAVYIVRGIRCDGTVMGSTNSPHARSIWVSVGAPGQTENYTERAFHHEVAHLLADTRRAQLPLRRWRAANAPGFKYTYGEGGGLAAVTTRQNSGDDLDPALCFKGVLSAYGATEFDEDWACYGERVVDPEPAFLAVTRRYSRVRAKAKLLADFYRKAMPGIQLPKLP